MKNLRTFQKKFLAFTRLSRWDKPIGTQLLLYPCLVSILLATPPGSAPDFLLLSEFTAGAFIMRGAGCTINDLWDHKLDSQVERTRTRPLASGELSLTEGISWLAAQSTVGLGILLQLNPFTQKVGALSLGLVSIYPLMKRVTWWPQLILGLTFNWGAFMGAAAVLGAVPLWSIPLYVGGIAWTLHYDTIYAHQDKKDDELVDIKSTARLFGDETKKYLHVFSTITTLSWGFAGYLANVSLPYYLTMGLIDLHFRKQIKETDLDDPDQCLKGFQSNKIVGLLATAGAGISVAMKFQPTLDTEKDESVEKT